MPFYEYLCTQCGATLEILQKISDPPATECRVCHEQALVKQVSAAGFRLKGGGWYETDFKSGDKRNLVNESGGETKSESNSSAAPASESKSSESSSDKTTAAAKPAESKPAEAPKATEKKAAEPAKKTPDAGKTPA